MTRSAKVFIVSGIAIGGLITVTTVGVAIGHQAGSSSKPAVVHTVTEPPAVTASPSASPFAVPSPSATAQGACGYDLSSDPVNGTAVATGDVLVNNTGNIGAVIKVTITWPQQGYSPLSMTKTVRIGSGASNDVQFHTGLDMSQLTNLQNWQLGHPGSDGCTYDATITDVFGNAR